LKSAPDQAASIPDPAVEQVRPIRVVAPEPSVEAREVKVRDRTVRSFLAELSATWLKRKLLPSGAGRSPKDDAPHSVSETAARKAQTQPLRRTAAPAHRPPPPDLDNIASHL
jgi:hypothetical protein